MAKYSFEFKKQVVLEYLSGSGGYNYLTEKHHIGCPAQLQRWVAAFQKYGDEGLFRSRQKEIYSFEKKLSVVELYLSGEISYQDLALQEGITNPSMIANWVNRFRAAGPDALRSRKKGRKKSLNTSDGNTQNKSVEESSVDTSAEHVKQLEDELLMLRIENAFLKELRRLRLEDEAKMRERRSSSTASDENSN